MRKKFTMLLVSLLACVGVIKAQISALTELDNSKAYLLKNANDMGYAIWKSGDNLTLCGASSTFTDALDATVAGSNWQIISYNGKYYLYNVGAKKFAVTQAGPTYLTATPTPITIEIQGSDFAFNSDGDPYHYMCAAHHLNPPVQWWSASDNGSAWQIIENTNALSSIQDLLTGATVVEEYFNSQVQVVFEYYIDGKLYHTSESVAHNLDIAPQVPALDYVTIGATDVETITENCTVKVTCTENLPFVSSTSYNGATWQVIDMHSNEDNYTWKYVAADVDVETPVVAKTQNSSLGEEYYWAFVGNLVDGFKIYNKAAGETLTLRKAENGNTASVMSAADDRNVFKLHKSASSISNSFCFKIDGDTYYLNKQNQKLRGWTSKDEGSSCRMFTPASFVLNALGGFENAPCGAVGSYSYLADAEKYATFSVAIAAVKANPYDIEALEALDELNMIADIVASEKVALTDGYYRIQNLFRNQNGVKNMIGIVNGIRNGAQGNHSTVDFIWQFETSESGYKIKSVNQGKYMDGVSNQDLTEEETAAEYTFVDLGAAQWNIKSGSQNLVMYNDVRGELGHWGSVAHNGDGAWYIIPATEIEVSLNEFASICLPFDVAPGEGVTAYAIESTNSTHAILAEKADIPAGEGAILEGTGTVTLNLTTASSVWTGNLLEGTTVDTYVAGPAYVLANGGNGIGLYKATLNKGEAGADGETHFKNNANKAYLPVVSNAPMFSFDRGEGTTGIENSELNVENSALIYDLLGRRVEKMEKGIYIVNGKKVVIK